MKHAIQAVLSSTTEQLGDLEYVESLIKEFGLFNDPRPRLYGSPYDDWRKIYPKYEPQIPGQDQKYKAFTYQDGGMFQIPRQIAQAVLYLRDKQIKSYLEVGAFYGYTFAFVTAYLSKFGLTGAIAYDSNQYMSLETIEEIRSTIGIKIHYMYREGQIEINGHKSLTRNLREVKFDLIFIDGNHAYSAVKADWENVGKYAKYCMIHDIDDMYIEDECEGGGPVQFWKELKYKYSEIISIPSIKGFADKRIHNRNMIEFTYHTENKRVMGIGIVQPREQS